MLSLSNHFQNLLGVRPIQRLVWSPVSAEDSRLGYSLDSEKGLLSTPFASPSCVILLSET